MKTIPLANLSDADRPFLCSRTHADGTITLYYPGDTIPAAFTPEELAAAQAIQAAGEADVAAARAHAKLKALAGMTPAQVQTWVTNNVTTLAAAQDAIATLAVAVSILARRL